MPGLVGKTCGLREKFFTANRDRDRLTAENKLVLALGTEIAERKKTTGSIVVLIQIDMTRPVET